MGGRFSSDGRGSKPCKRLRRPARGGRAGTRGSAAGAPRLTAGRGPRGPLGRAWTRTACGVAAKAGRGANAVGGGGARGCPRQVRLVAPSPSHPPAPLGAVDGRHAQHVLGQQLPALVDGHHAQRGVAAGGGGGRGLAAGARARSAAALTGVGARFGRRALRRRASTPKHPPPPRLTRTAHPPQTPCSSCCGGGNGGAGGSLGTSRPNVQRRQLPQAASWALIITCPTSLKVP